jgi:hypothetical protein
MACTGSKVIYAPGNDGLLTTLLISTTDQDFAARPSMGIAVVQVSTKARSGSHARSQTSALQTSPGGNIRGSAQWCLSMWKERGQTKRSVLRCSHPLAFFAIHFLFLLSLSLSILILRRHHGQAQRHRASGLDFGKPYER